MTIFRTTFIKDLAFSGRPLVGTVGKDYDSFMTNATSSLFYCIMMVIIPDGLCDIVGIIKFVPTFKFQTSLRCTLSFHDTYSYHDNI